ncbi:MAG: hypothetical protein ABIO67_00210 [Mycobacteriales bacterium]
MNPQRVVAGALVASALPMVLGLVAVRPADAEVPVTVTAAGPAYDQYGLTALASGVRTDGIVGNAGGLVTLDTGSAYVAARLDASPSSEVLAAPYEPGALFRTVVGQVNGGAGQVVIDVPDAEAGYPGEGKSSLTTVPSQTIGPLSTGSGSASAVATETTADGTATGSSSAITGVVTSEGSVSTVSMKVLPTAAKVVSTASTRVGRVFVAGVLELRDVVATASITADGDTHAALAGLTIGAASVAGQAVTIDQDGVRAAGTLLIPGQTIAGATDQVNAVLKGAGVKVQTTASERTTTGRSATADSGGVVITVATSDLPGGVAANALTVTVGGVSLTETDALRLPAIEVPAVAAPHAPPSVGSPAVTSTTTIPGTPGTAGSAAATLPTVAMAPASFTLAGRSLSAAAALAAFAVWQFLSLGTATLYALVERRRRLGLA